MKHKELTSKIIECAYKVHNDLGFGFLENVYQNALLIELNCNSERIPRSLSKRKRRSRLYGAAGLASELKNS